jgi:MYXO-CTERM domain-containing protein
MRRWAAVVGAICAGAAALAVPATAHQSDPSIVTRIDAVEPALPDVTIEVRAGVADQLLVVNTTPTPVTVVATGGEPFLRIGPTTVEANTASPDWYRSNSPLGAARVPATATPKAKPTWRVVARGSSWGWFDHRMHPVTRPITAELRAARTTVRLADWTIPLRYGTTTASIKGHVEYRPLLGAFHSTVTKAPSGVALEVLDGRVPGLFLRWTGNGTLLVRGIAGEPFARLTPQGTEVNEASPTWQDDQRLRGAPPLTTPADPRAEPRWRRQGSTPQLTWLDRRLAYAPGFPPDDVASDPHPTTLVEWEIPAEIDSATAHLSGTTVWQPNATPGEDTSKTFLYGAIAAGAVALAGLALLRRRAR